MAGQRKRTSGRKRATPPVLGGGKQSKKSKGKGNGVEAAHSDSSSIDDVDNEEETRDEDSQPDSDGSEKEDEAVSHSVEDLTANKVPAKDGEGTTSLESQHRAVNSDAYHYPQAMAEHLLKTKNTNYEKDLLDFTAAEIFPGMKFILEEKMEKKLCRAALNKGYVKLFDKRIPKRLFVDSHHKLLSGFLTKIRTNSQAAAQKKYQDTYKKSILPSNHGMPKEMPKDTLQELLIADDYRDYLDDNGQIKEGMADKYKAFKYFVSRLLPRINNEITKTLKKQELARGERAWISKVFTVSDEAYGLWMIANYEKRWRNQVLYPAGKKKQGELPHIYAARYTSYKHGFSKIPWTQEGVKMFNDLVARVKACRANRRTGALLETQLHGELERNNNLKNTRTQAAQVLVHKPVVSEEMQEMLDGMDTDDDD